MNYAQDQSISSVGTTDTNDGFEPGDMNYAQDQSISSVGTTDTQLVLTYNFATANTVTTTYKLQTLTTELQLLSKPQNCELKQEPCTLPTELHPPLKFLF